MDYGKALTDYMKKNGLTQGKLALKIGCSRVMVRDYLEGISKPVKFKETIDKMLAEK